MESRKIEAKRSKPKLKYPFPSEAAINGKVRNQSLLTSKKKVHNCRNVKRSPNV